MKMTKASATPICECCSNRIKSYGFMCFDIMDQICTNTIDKNISYYCEAYSCSHVKEVIRFLEYKQLLLTTDIDELMVVIRPDLKNGKFDSEKGEFCWCNIKS